MIYNVLVNVPILYIAVLSFIVLPAYSLSVCPQNQRTCTRLPYSRLYHSTTALLQGVNDNNDVDNDSRKGQANFGINENATEAAIDLSNKECNNKYDNESMSQDLTDRFKYKVNALMGAYDPIDSTSDTEKTQGNILNALLNFPVVYTFHVVGRTSGNESLQSIFIEQVKDVIDQCSSTPTTLLPDDNEKNCVVYDIAPRGTKFTKVSIQKEVINAQEIAFIYDQLSKLELSIMQF